jgi:GT2 family glycosyltransferase
VFNPSKARQGKLKMKDPQKNMDLSIVILSWNDCGHLEECLESLALCTKTRSMEIIVVDNASTDGSADMVQTRFPHVKLVRNTENLGFPKGNNLGMSLSTGKYVCLLNSDIKVFEGCMDVLADFMDKNPKAGMVGPRILNGDLTHQSSCRNFPTLWNNFCSASGLVSLFPRSRFWSGEHMFHFGGDRQIDVDVLVGCFWMVRREALDQFGPLDEGFFMYAEDVDWCKRCWESGWRVVFVPAAQAVHYRGGSSSRRDPVWVELTQQRSLLRYWRKHHGIIGRMGIRCLLAVHRSVRLSAAFASRILTASNREDSRTRMRVSWACLQDAFRAQPADNASSGKSADLSSRGL